jgi:hypothetical protein
MKDDGIVAFGAPGIEPRWTSSTKDAIGTAYAASSRVWFTISHGILNEIYYPRIDTPQMRDMEFLITDGQSFFHEEKRDLRHDISPLEPGVLGYRVTSRDRQGRYALIKEYIADPHQACVLINVRLEGAPDFLSALKLYLLAAPHLGGGGLHNTGWQARVVGRLIMAAARENSFLAVGATVPFSRGSAGYVGTSDGWRDLRDNFRMDYDFELAVDATSRSPPSWTSSRPAPSRSAWPSATRSTMPPPRSTSRWRCRFPAIASALSTNGIGPAPSAAPWSGTPAMAAACTTPAAASCWPTRTRPTPAPPSPL